MLLRHEKMEEDRAYMGAMLQLGAIPAQNKSKLVSHVSELYRPGHKDREDAQLKKDMNYLASLRDVNWGKVFTLDPEFAADREEIARRQDASPLYGSYTKARSL
jgi:hypothetical protein